MATSIKYRTESSPNGRKDAIRYRAGRALDECATQNNTLARVLGVSPSETSRRRRGSPGHGTGTEAAFYEALVRLQVHDKTTPYPLIVDALAFVAEALEDVSDDALVARFWRLVRHEAEREAAENTETATYALHGNLTAIADAMQAEAAVGLELAAVCRELHKREVEPRGAK